jgi:hypothetical protein
MKKFVIEEAPGDVFWKKYAELWNSSKDKSAFKAPLLLKYFSKISDNVVAVQLVDDERFLGAFVLYKKKNNYFFLSDLKSDFNFFVFHSDCTENDLEFFFTSFFKEAGRRHWKLTLNNVPDWAPYMKLFESCGSKSNLYFKKIDYGICPAIEGNDEETAFDIVNHSRQYRYSINRLKSQLNAEFEVLTDDQHLEEWANEFFEAHILRWKDTSTPSKFESSEYREFVLKCLKAWSEQKILVRFSIVVEQRRIGFVIGLLETGKLIHHSTTFHPEYRRYGAGKAVIFAMTKWMLENDLNVLDFGSGDEEYKFVLANKTQTISRIFISSKTALSFILKAKLIAAIKDRPNLYKFYREKIKIHFNGTKKTPAMDERVSK